MSHFPPSSTSAVIPLEFRCCLNRNFNSFFIFILFWQLIVFTILAFYLFIQVLQWSRFIGVTAIELLYFLGTTYKVLYRVLCRVWVISFLTNIVLQRSPYQFIGQYFFNFLFVIAINLNQLGRFIPLSKQQVIYSFLQLIQ